MSTSSSGSRKLANLTAAALAAFASAPIFAQAQTAAENIQSAQAEGRTDSADAAATRFANRRDIRMQVIGFRDGKVLSMPLEDD